MKITLRKANALQNSISEAIKNIRLESEIRINEFQNAEVEWAKANDEFHTNLTRKLNLTNALYAIRKAVAIGNVTAGIDHRLTEVANVEKNIQIYTEAASRSVREDAVVLNGKLDKIRNQPADARSSIYGRHDEVSTGIVTESDIEYFRKFLASAKKEKQRLQDQILEANVRTEITLDQSTVDLLTAENLL